MIAALGAAFGASAQTFPPCEREPTASDLEGAKGAHKAAEAHYNKGAYERAIQAWMDAYGFDCTAHRLLINVGNAQEKLGKLPEAIEAFETYIARAGEGADPTIQDKVANLKARLQQPTQPTSTAPTGPAPTTTGGAPPPPPPDDQEPSEGPGVAPWIVVGLGGAVTIVGVVLIIVGQKKLNEAEDVCGAERDCSTLPNQSDRQKYADMGNTGRTLTGVGGAATGVGLAAVVGGVVWYVVASRDDGDPPPAARAWVQPLVSPWSAGLGVAGTFF